MKLNATFSAPRIGVEVTAPTMSAPTGTPVARDFVDRDPYAGEYVVTPSAEEQVLQTRNLRMTDNITVNPVPQNYGLITWNGSYLTVS